MLAIDRQRVGNPVGGNMKIDLDGKTVVVTGAAQGLGAEVSRIAIECGAEAVLLTDRNTAGGETVASSLGGNASFFNADLSHPDAPSEIITTAAERFGRVDCLVNAAGLTDRASMLDGTISAWETLYAVNARAPFFLMQNAITDMRKRKSAGAIVNILSMNAHCGTPELAIYSSTKGALSTLTKNAANAHLSDRIRVNGINMGWCPTPSENKMQAETLGKGGQWKTEAARDMPLGRMLQPEEVARLAVFLLSDCAGLLTGTLIDMEQTIVGAPALA